MFKNFRVKISLRIVLITLLIGLMLYFLIIEKRYLRSAYLLIFIVILIGELIWLIDRTNRDITSFLMALMQNDFTTTFSESQKGKSFEKLYQAFNLITQKFKDVSSERQAQHIYLETLVEHVKVGIISFDQDEKVHLMNEALKKMLGKPSILYLKSLQAVSDELVTTLRGIRPGDQKLVKVTVNNNLLQLAIHASTFKLQDKQYKLVSIQNIKNELESNELDAWQKLIRVLTHEIMNSVTPISSLTETLSLMAANENQKKIPNPEVLPKIQQGLEAIKLRSEGLQTFTQAYKSLTRIPPPSFSQVNLHDLLHRIETLFEKEIDTIQFSINVSSDIEVIADPALLEQVLINLVKNALEAVQDTNKPAITISAHKTDKVIINISDNGMGIDEDKQDKIFIPFFTTKSHGSGIGLALSREIIRLHKGSINVQSAKNQGTLFTISI